MRTHLASLGGALLLLLVGSAILFLVGSTIERNHRHHESSAAKPADVSGGESGNETGGEGAQPAETHVESAHGEAGAKILGINTESLALSIIAVVLSLLLASAIWLGVWARLVLLAVVVFGLVFAAGDGREIVHQLDESNGGLAAIAAILIALHVAVAALAALLLRRRSLPALPASEPSA